MWMMPLHLHVNQKSDYDYDDDDVMMIFYSPIKVHDFTHKYREKWLPCDVLNFHTNNVKIVTERISRFQY